MFTFADKPISDLVISYEKTRCVKSNIKIKTFFLQRNVLFLSNPMVLLQGTEKKKIPC